MNHRELQEIFQVMKNKGLQPRLLYLARLSIKIEGQMRRFPDKRRVKKYTSTKTNTARYAKETALRKGRKIVREGGIQV